MGTMFRLVLRMQVTRARAAGLLGLGAMTVVIAFAVGANNDAIDSNAHRMYDLIDGLGLAVLAPVAALVLASAALGDLAEDRTLVYVWLHPVQRAQLVLGALAATLTVGLPFVLVPLALSVAVGRGGGELLGATLASATLAVVGYTALFLGLGLRVRRALVWGLAYVVIWEGAVARAAKGAARLSVQVYARSVLAHLSDQPLPRQAAAVGTSLLVIALIAVGAYFVTVRWLQRADVA
jgi:ABC-2 type transport system permease protein